MKKNTTKRSLLASVLALVMCVTMLVGTTFAWFTDSASTSVNKIEAGKLDIDVFYADTADGGAGSKWTKLDNNSPALSFLGKQVDGSLKQDAAVLWEPNCTYSLPALKVVNNGNLALKYRVTVTGIKGDAKLNEVIDWTFGGLDLVDGAAVGALLPKAESDVITIKGHMLETAGNEYQGLTIDGIGITVYATQDTVEFDSFNNTYDAAAPWVGGYDDAGLAANADAAAKTLKIESAEQLASFAKAVNSGNAYDGYTVTLMNNIDLNGIEWVQIKGSNHNITFDGNGKTISNLKITKGHDAGFFANGVALTVKNVTFDRADVSAVGRVAVIVGHGMCATVENCKVINSSVKAVVTNNDDGDKAGAVVGYLSGEPVAKVVGCTVENCTVQGYRDVGGLVGYAGKTYTVTGNTVKNVTLINDRTNNYKHYTSDAEYDVNDVIGDQGSEGTAENNRAEGCTLRKIAKVAGKSELKSAVANAGSGDVIVLGEDLTLSNESVFIDKPITIDLGSNTVSQNGHATFVVKNSSDVTIKNGKFSLSGSQPRAVVTGKGSFYGVDYDAAGADVTIENVDFDISGSQGVAVSAGTNSGGVLTIKGGTYTVSGSQAKALDIGNCHARISGVNIRVTGNATGMNFSSVLEDTMVDVSDSTVEVLGAAPFYDQDCINISGTNVNLTNCKLIVRSAAKSGRNIEMSANNWFDSKLTIKGCEIINESTGTAIYNNFGSPSSFAHSTVTDLFDTTVTAKYPFGSYKHNDSRAMFVVHSGSYSGKVPNPYYQVVLAEGSSSTVSGGIYTVKAK